MEKHFFNGGIIAPAAESVQPQVKASVMRERVLKHTDKVLARARKIYGNQLDKTPEMKARAIRKALAEVGDPTITELNFLAKYVERMAMLLDSKNFWRECEKHQLDAYTLGTNLAFYGVRKCQKVIRNGLAECSDLLCEMKKPVFQLEELKKVDGCGLLSEITAPVGLLPQHSTATIAV